MNECGTAFIAAKWLQSAMSLDVRFYAGRGFTSEAAQLTTEWLFSTVCFEVSVEAICLCAGV